MTINLCLIVFYLGMNSQKMRLNMNKFLLNHCHILLNSSALFRYIQQSCGYVGIIILFIDNDDDGVFQRSQAQYTLMQASLIRKNAGA